MLELVRQHVDRLVAFDVAQSAAGSSSLVHVDYYQLVDAPDEVMPEVFAGIGLEWTPDGGAADPRVARGQPEGQAGHARVPTSTTTASTATTVAEAFADYIERFDIPSERRAGR